ncbi:DMT family transporter [Actinoplanes sp. NPDC049265]|uniref:DMT family transporter n=1 Tax=Actinoplanes sp. NPDC049265 TaxID=3363902 RepID=UPI00371845C3
MNRRAWSLFVLVSVLWGIPYLLIKVAIEDLSPGLVVAGRVLIAALVLVPFAARRGTLVALRGRYGTVATIAVIHVVIPFLLITYGETHITSSLTGLLIAIEPAAIALLMLRREPLTRGRAAGLVVGFAGVGLLVGLDVSGDRLGLLGAGMVLLAALSYAVATILVQRRAAGLPPEALAAGTTSVAAVLLAPVGLLTLPTAPVHALSWAALIGLGLLCTALAMLAFYELIGLAGSGRAGLVTYANPVVAVLLGVMLLNEPFGVPTAVGFALVAAGCWLSTRRPRPGQEGRSVTVERMVPAGQAPANVR